MRTTIPRWLAAGMTLCVLTLGVPLRAADDDEALRKRALGLNRVTGEDPIQGEVLTILKDAAAAKKLVAVAAKMAQEKKQPFNYNGAIILADVARRLRDLENGQTFYNICTQEATRLKSGEKMADAYSGLISLLFEHRKYEEATKVCQKFLDLPDEDPRGAVSQMKLGVLLRMIQGLAQQGKTDDATKMIDDLLKKDKRGTWFLLEVKAQVEREAGRNDEAAKFYEQVLERLAKDEDMPKDRKEGYIESTRYRLSNVYVDAKKVDKAAEQLKKLLEQKPDDPTYNNDLGYIWADHNMNLDEAEKLIRKAIDEDRKQRKKLPDLTPDEDRDNAAYLDSLGWVLYKKKQHKEALDWLVKATQEREGDHVEILDHLAEVYLALEQKDKAVATWEKALKAISLGKRDEQRKEDVKKKLEMHKK